MGNGYQLLSVNVKSFVMVKRMVIPVKEISFSYVKQKGFGEKIHSHNVVFFFNVDTSGVKQL